MRWSTDIPEVLLGGAGKCFTTKKEPNCLVCEETKALKVLLNPSELTSPQAASAGRFPMGWRKASRSQNRHKEEGDVPNPWGGSAGLWWVTENHPVQVLHPGQGGSVSSIIPCRVVALLSPAWGLEGDAGVGGPYPLPGWASLGHVMAEDDTLAHPPSKLEAAPLCFCTVNNVLSCAQYTLCV